MSVLDVRTAFKYYLKVFLKKIKIPSLPIVFFPLMLPPNDNFLRMASAMYNSYKNFKFYNLRRQTSSSSQISF